MPLAGTAANLKVPGRDEEVVRYKDNYQVRNPAADVGDGSQPDVDAKVSADTNANHYANAIVIANGTSRSTRTGQQLDDDAEEHGTQRFPAVGASGQVAITAAAGGTTIQSGDEIKVNGTRYRCTTTGVYQDGAFVPITGTDTGPGTNQRPGAIGTWTAPRPGCGESATVVAQQDGEGLSGGNNKETDDQLRRRLDDLAANPPASGNDAEYQFLLEKTPNVAVEQGYTWALAKGPCSIAVTLTLRPPQPGASRIPNSTHLALMMAWLTGPGQMPAQDGIYPVTLLANPVNVNLRVTWAQGAAGWIDGQPWPPYVGGSQIAIDGGQPITPTAFSLTGNNGVNVAPTVGQSIGVLDLGNGTFRKKRIATIATSGTDWVVTVDVTDKDTDQSYAPFGGQIVCPWSDSLNDVFGAVVSYMDTLGPGEQLASNQFVDPGLRQRRSPPNPAEWPSTLSNRLITPVLALASMQDAIFQDPTVPYAAPVGTPGAVAYLTTMRSLACFAE